MNLPEIIELPHVPTRAEINRLQGEMMKLPQAELKTEHYFANGMYARKVWRPAGCLIVGKVHKHEHFFMLMEGALIVWTDQGMKEIQSGTILTSKPGTKRVTLALKDSIGLTVHRTELKDLDEIEAEIIESEPALFDARNALKELT